MKKTVVLNPDQFKAFVRCLSVLKKECNDVDIRGGKVRQRTNDTTAIFETFFPELKSMDIQIPELSDKIKILRLLVKEKKDVEITVTRGDVSFSFFKYDKLNLEFLDNKFIEQQELDKIFMLKEGDLILKCDIIKEISKEIKKVSSASKKYKMWVGFSGSVAGLFIERLDKPMKSTALRDIPVLANADLRCEATMIAFPFVMDHDGSIELRMYNYTNELSVNKFSTSISNINVNVYTRSYLGT